ncbi:MAG TPA: hypothetical protein DCY91_21860 [Cyanobacteria bacterium UBA11370]|nr:hypothetical protein [Cyanobacteria bacterium UBA11370]
MRIHSFILLSTVLLSNWVVNSVELEYSFSQLHNFDSKKLQRVETCTDQSRGRTTCSGDACRGNGRREILTS